MSYTAAAELLAEHDAQMVKGGLLVRGDPPAGLALYDRVELEIGGAFAPLDRAPVKVEGQVVQIIAGVGVAVVFDPSPLQPVVAALRAGAARPAAATPNPSIDTAAKIQLALHGTRDDRMRILRDNNKMLHSYVLRNPQLGLDEVLAIAKMSTIAPDILAAVGAQKEWQRPDIALALVRNPKTPVPVAVRMLDFVTPADIRQLAKDSHTKPQVQQAARKKLFGPG